MRAAAAGGPEGDLRDGNVATETLVYMFESAGIKTGLDLGKLLGVADSTMTFLDREPSQAAHALAADYGVNGGWAHGSVGIS